MARGRIESALMESKEKVRKRGEKGGELVENDGKCDKK